MKLRLITIFLLGSIEATGLATELTKEEMAINSRISTANSAWSVSPSGLGLDLGVKRNSGTGISSTWTHLGVSKGIIWPITFGVNFAANEPLLAHQLGGWAQYSIIQVAKFPSLAGRVKYSECYFGSVSRSKNWGAEAIVSYGIGPVSLQAAAELNRSNLSIEEEVENDEESISNISNSTLSQHIQTYGISLQLGYLAKFSINRSTTKNRGSTVSGQLQFEM